jgi:3-hydroxymyristoyl/3-hydroxydecanoyl-(acyl carrier protein) dehydratase
VSTKFLQAVAPERRIDVTIKFAAEQAGRWKARFVAANEGTPVLEGSFLLASSAESETP